MKKLTGVKVLIWDFDGTFYHATKESHDKIREAEYRVIDSHTGWDREKTIAEFHQVFGHETPSGTITTAKLSGISTTQAAIESEKHIDRSKFLRPDPTLVDMLRSLSGFRQFMLVNGLQSVTRVSLSILGIPIETFEEIVTSEVVGENKPDLRGFQYILDWTKLPADSHLMIGDRPKIDLEPAKKLGMKTCLVWSDKRDPSADVVLPSIYDVSSLLL